MDLLQRYQSKLDSLRTTPPGCGLGYHQIIMGVVNAGVLAGLSLAQIFSDIRRSTPKGNREVSDKEIIDTIEHAFSDLKTGAFKGGTFKEANWKGGASPRQNRPAPLVKDGAAALKNIIAKSAINSMDELRETSPVKIPTNPKEHPALLLRNCFQVDEFGCIRQHIGQGIVGSSIRTIASWIAFFENGGRTAEHVIINPLSGLPGMTKSGKKSFQCDACVSKYRHVEAEFDDISLDDQARFWSVTKLPIVALIYSGGKSIHCWLDVQRLARVETADDWQEKIKAALYGRILTPLGMDGACSNPSRLSRLPGHFRTDTGNYQRLLWLTPQAGGAK